jgi:RNase P protein component
MDCGSLFNSLSENLFKSFDYVIIARKFITGASFLDMTRELRKVVGNIELTKIQNADSERDDNKVNKDL